MATRCRVCFCRAAEGGLDCAGRWRRYERMAQRPSQQPDTANTERHDARASFGARLQRNQREILLALALTVAAAILLIVHFSR